MVSRPLTIELPDEAFAALARAARISGTTPEDVARRSLSGRADLGGDRGCALRLALQHLGLVTGAATEGLDDADYAAFEPLHIAGPPVSETLVAERR
jgi:hypothetical protein